MVTDNLSLTTVKSHPHHQALSGPLMGMRMPIYRLLKDTAFEPEAVEAMVALTRTYSVTWESRIALIHLQRSLLSE